MAGYWRTESSGVLRPVVERYLTGVPLSPKDIMIMRAYLQQWVDDPMFRGVENLRKRVDNLTTEKAIDHWIQDAVDQGLDPL